MTDIAGFGFQINLIASNTYPTGVILTQFADDADPFDLPSLQIADSAMGLNGDLLTWSKANPIKMTLSMVPAGLGDIALGILLEANRVGKGKFGARDIITLTGIYPSGATITLINGTITDGIPGQSISSAGRFKSKPYNFVFENKIGLS
jgi:hypothetical protein